MSKPMSVEFDAIRFGKKGVTQTHLMRSARFVNICHFGLMWKGLVPDRMT